MSVRTITPICLLLFAGLILSVTTSKTHVPQAVKEAFAAKFPGAKKVKWEIEAQEEYEADFKMARKKMSANFKADGTWLETEIEIKEKDLPAAVVAAIGKDFPGYEIEEAEQLETPQRSITYEVEIEDEKTDMEIEAIFAADGTLLSKEMDDDDDDDDDEN